MKNYLLLLLVCCSHADFYAQNPAMPLEKITFMLGEWQGKGRIKTRAGEVYANVAEKVECKLDCNIIVVQGLGVKTDSLTGEPQNVHDAFGIITADRVSGKYFLRAYKKGEATDSEIVFIGEKVIQWGFGLPSGGKVRFTVDFSEPGKWKETGEFSMDGLRWMQTMYMELDKIR